jgi:hypothetical protein
MRDAQARWLNGSRGQGQSSRLRVPTDEEPFSLEIGGLSETCTQTSDSRPFAPRDECVLVGVRSCVRLTVRDHKILAVPASAFMKEE